MLVDKLLEASDTHPQKLAVSDPVRELSYAKLTTFSRIMRDLILRECQCSNIGILLPGSTANVGVLFGCLWAGKTAVPLNFLLQPAELKRIVADSGIDTIFSIKHFHSLVDQMGVKYIFLEDVPFNRKFLISKFRRTPQAPAWSKDQTAVILYTSGTSGAPKGVQLSYENLYSNCRDCMAHAQIDTDHTLLSVLPPFHVFGLTAMTLLPIWGGMTVYYIPRFSPVKAVKTIEEKRISVFMAIPSMYAAMSRVKHASAECFSSLFLAISGGEPLQESTCQLFQEEFGLQINQGYGLTETSPVISIDLPWDGSPGSVGKPIPNCQVCIVASDGTHLGPNQDGEIRVKGPNIMKGYYHLENDTASVFDSQGWFKTGDQGHLDERGLLSVTGRIKEMMIIGGENVFPSEIEKVLVQHSAVEEAAVIGVPDSSRGEVAIAFVISTDKAKVDENELRSLCRSHLASFKVPRQIILEQDLPRGPTGKILKRALKDRVQEVSSV